MAIADINRTKLTHLLWWWHTVTARSDATDESCCHSWCSCTDASVIPMAFCDYQLALWRKEKTVSATEWTFSMIRWHLDRELFYRLSLNCALHLRMTWNSCENIKTHWPLSPKRLVCLQIEDVADGAVKPPPNKIPIFFFGTHETWVHLMSCGKELFFCHCNTVDLMKTFVCLFVLLFLIAWHFHTSHFFSCLTLVFDL